MHLADRAVYWQEEATLLLADVHLGRSQTLRSRGVFLPLGSDQADLDRISALVRHFSAREMVVLGDLFHASAGMTPDTLDLFEQWLAEVHIPLRLIEGNHDRHALRKCCPRGLERRSRAVKRFPFLLAHEPCTHPTLYPLCGHLHPGIRLEDKAGCSLKTKAYWFREKHALLPAFGSTTSLSPLTREAGDKVFVCQ